MVLTTSDPGSRTFADDELLLDEVLTAAIASTSGPEITAINRRAVDLASAARAGQRQAEDELRDLVGGLDPAMAAELVSSLTRFFWLNNLAEDNERVRRLRARERSAPDEPRRGSIHAAIRRLADTGITAEEMQARLAEMDICLVMTAHPTEARRRTTLDKQARIFSILRELDERALTRDGERRARERLLATTQELWASDDLRAIELTPLDEVRSGLVYFVSTLADVVPEIYRDIEDALKESFPQAPIAVPPLLSFGSWIGGDRDGNPHVTPSVTEEALDLMREQCVRLLEGRIELLQARLSLSDRIAGRAPGLSGILHDGTERFPELAQTLAALNPEEPYRRALTFMRERLRATEGRLEGGYGGPDELLADLRTIERSLIADGGAFTAAGDLRDVIRQVEVFGFHFARLDIREHAGRHRAALAEIFGVLGIHDGYAGLRSRERCDLLCRAIADPRPVIPAETGGFSEPTQEVIETLRMVRRALDGNHGSAIGSYIVSGTEAPEDLLEVLLLMKEAALTKAGGGGSCIPVVPLFESGDTLAAAANTISDLLDRSVYRAALSSVGDIQEVMIGYSDSNKDTGYGASGWATYKAQTEIAATLQARDVRWMFFHGRGGAVGRGGGPTNVAIAALPPGSVAGAMKMTEQGEVLATKYAVSEVAHRELELTTSAVLETIATDHEHRLGAHVAEFDAVMDRIADESARTYSELVYEDPDFLAFFSAATPVDEISRLRLGSRPARRSAAAGIADLRAIPWVFAWTQARIVLPAWYGLGSGLRAARERHGLDKLIEMRQRWPFFAALLSNAEMGCAKADLRIAHGYVSLFAETEPRTRIWSAIESEFQRTCEELILIHGGQRLLDSEPVLQASIDRRNPHVDPLSHLQVELLRRLRSTPEPDPGLERAALLTINGIAGGLRNTG